MSFTKYNINLPYPADYNIYRGLLHSLCTADHISCLEQIRGNEGSIRLVSLLSW